MAVETYRLEDDSGDYLLEDDSGSYLLESSDPPPPFLALNKFLFVSIGDGMSMSEKIR